MQDYFFFNINHIFFSFCFFSCLSKYRGAVSWGPHVPILLLPPESVYHCFSHGLRCFLFPPVPRDLNDVFHFSILIYPPLRRYPLIQSTSHTTTKAPASRCSLCYEHTPPTHTTQAQTTVAILYLLPRALRGIACARPPALPAKIIPCYCSGYIPKPFIPVSTDIRVFSVVPSVFPGTPS